MHARARRRLLFISSDEPMLTHCAVSSSFCPCAGAAFQRVTLSCRTRRNVMNYCRPRSQRSRSRDLQTCRRDGLPVGLPLKPESRSAHFHSTLFSRHSSARPVHMGCQECRESAARTPVPRSSRGAHPTDRRRSCKAAPSA